MEVSDQLHDQAVLPPE